MSELSEPRIVCAAVQLKSGLVIPSARHLDMTMRLLIASLNVGTLQGSLQGFIDQHGQFYDRKKAWDIAKGNGQIFRETSSPPGTLYSENLY